MPSKPEVVLTRPIREALELRVRSRSSRADDARKARLILMLADGETFDAIVEGLGCSPTYVSRWKKRFLEDSLAGLHSRHLGKAAKVLTPKMEGRILAATRRKPTDGSTHWTTRKLAKHLGVSHMLVHRVWARAGIKPQSIRRYMLSDDPDFEAKAADVIGLYLNPPQHAAVFCVDEKSHIQALDRLDPVLPLSPGRLERHGFEYYRHGTLSLFAALNTRTGKVLGETVERHTSEDFVAFLGTILASESKGKEIHIVLDNLSTHKTRRVQQFLADHPNVHLHFTPTYSSWLNQVENWFSKIERDLIARGIFTSKGDLARKIMRYIKHHNVAPKPMRWTYSNPERRIRGISSTVTVHVTTMGSDWLHAVGHMATASTPQRPTRKRLRSRRLGSGSVIVASRLDWGVSLGGCKSAPSVAARPVAVRVRFRHKHHSSRQVRGTPSSYFPVQK